MNISERRLCINRGYCLFEIKKTGDELAEVTFEIRNPHNEIYKELGSLTQALAEFNEIITSTSNIKSDLNN